MRGRFGNRVSRRFAPLKPSRAWSSIATAWTATNVTATTLVTLVQLQSPTDLTNLTSDPPEDLTLLRIRGQFSVALTGGPAVWTMALTVQDTIWTPATVFASDADKRILWSRTFQTVANTAVQWNPPGQLDAGGTILPSVMEFTEIDIAPKVRIEAGQALNLVLYEDAGAFAFSTSSVNMRVLYQRTARKR